MAPPADQVECAELLDGLEPATGNYFVSTYPPFSAWQPEQVDRVGGFLNEAPPADVPLGLYVHIPFCVKRCDYCYYLSYADKSRAEIRDYLAAVARELSMYAPMPLLAGRKLSFAYFGGGTPSLLPPGPLGRLIAELQAIVPWTGTEEVTFECAPRSVSPAKLRILREAGVTRISLGVQQFDDGVLRANGRVHLVGDVERAWGEIRQAGFDLVNIDLIAGLVGETEASFMRSVDRAIELGAESVTIYQLEIPHNTPLYRALDHGLLGTELPAWEMKRARLQRAFVCLEEAGYTVRSAYAAVRDPRRHRFVYQDAQYHGADLLGIGLAAFSYLGGVHVQNVTDLGRYVDTVGRGELPLGRAYALSDEERLVREFVLQLKLGNADAACFRDKFGVDIRERFAEPLAQCARRGWLVADERGVRLTRDGLLRVDRLIPAFYLPRHRGVRYT